MILNLSSVNSGLGVSTSFSNSDYLMYENTISSAVAEFSKRANQPGQFLNWVD